MRLLFDQNISHRLIRQVKDIFPEARQVRNLRIENYSDKDIWEYAKTNNYTIVTFDADFYDYSLVWGYPPKIVWLRSYNQTKNVIEQILRKNLLKIAEFVDSEDLACLEIISI